MSEADTCDEDSVGDNSINNCILATLGRMNGVNFLRVKVNQLCSACAKEGITVLEVVIARQRAGVGACQKLFEKEIIREERKTD